ncbi:MAG: ABC transporter substrate-binding protein, partial [Thermodesulfobacteriota bacterium]
MTEDKVRIGTFGPQSGPVAAWGSVVRGMETYFRMINDLGGVHGRKLELVSFDDGYDPARTVAGVKEMTGPGQEGVFALAGGVGTRPGLAVLN